MNLLEKLGLIMWVSGIVMMASLFILGSGNAAHAVYNGMPIDSTLPLFDFILGTAVFVFSGFSKN